MLFQVLEKEMATHSSILAWRIPWTEEPGGLSSRGRKESETTERLHFHFLSLFPGSVGNTFRYSDGSVLFTTIIWQFSNHSFEENREQSEYFFSDTFPS